MPSKEYMNFLSVLLWKYRAKHIWVIVISSLLIACISAFFFVTSSIKKDLFLTLDAQADFVVQKYRAGKVEEIPKEWISGFREIDGIEKVNPRIYGMHFYDPSETYFMIVGLDFSQKDVVKNFEQSFPNIKINEFLAKDNMIIGQGVKELFEYYQYKDYYIFRPPNKGKQKVYFHSELPSESQIYTNDMILMDSNLAKKILGIPKNHYTDIALEMKKGADAENVKISLILSHFDMRIISKEEIKKHYENLFNYKGGVFLALYIFTLMTFLLILYQRYSNIIHADVKEIAILRVLGWKISDVIYLKLAENFIVAIFSYLLGVIMAYMYVYTLDAPLLKEIFLGFKNLNNTSSFTPSIDISSLISIFFIFVVPFMLVIILPVWKISVREPVEVMR